MIILEEKKEASLASVVITVTAIILIVGLAGGFYYFMTAPVPSATVENVETYIPPVQQATAPEQTVPQGPSTTVITYSLPAPEPATIKQGSCSSASLLQPYRADAFKCVSEGKTFDPCFAFKTGQSEKVVCPVNPAEPQQAFLIIPSLPLPKITPKTPEKENYAWFVELEEGALLSPYTGKSPVVNGVSATYGSKAVNGQITVFTGELAAGQLWTAQKKVISKSGTVWVEKSSEIANIKTVWK